jgi:D-amino-acid dehydrogenase
VLDARATGLGASAVNAGWFVPAEATPVPGPKMVGQTLRWMLRRDSPVYIRPSLDPRFVAFLLGMWRRSNARDQRAGFEAHLRLASDTAEVLDAYRDDGVEFEMRAEGLLMTFTDRENLEHHLRALDLVRRFDLDPRVLIGDDVRAHEPQLSDNVHGGIFFPHERHLDPRAMVQGLHARLLELGVKIVEHTPVTGVRTTGSSRRSAVTAVVTESGPVEGDAFVLAAGAWTGRLSALFGYRLPVRPGKGYSIDVPAVPLRSATNLSDAKVALSPYGDRLRLAGTMEFAGLDERVNDVRVRAILRAPTAYLRDWRPPTGPLPPQAGMRPMTPDGIPAIGRLPGTSNTFVSTGHGMLGVTLAAGSARALTALVVHGTRSPQLAPFDPARF